jgi:lipopolysaccharide transport system ATP-binding protein
MSNIAVKVENLGKMYRIGGKQEKYQTLRDTLTDAFTGPLKRARNLLRGQAYGAANLTEEIWALQDINFEIKHGEVVGIIGRNGAGKSTLLKILSRITEPTTGYVDIYGRVGALLEVGTGFHPELTGRENIYLNGAILGMSRNDIDRKFDEIVDFAGVEKFIDTPVKHYSSGMGLRLGFSVAAHLEPEILVVDEVLAVGDAEFQKKCLGKMSDVASEGRTVLFVSHNMGAVLSLTSKSMLISRGRLEDTGDSSHVVQAYLKNSFSLNETSRNIDISQYRRRSMSDMVVEIVSIELQQHGDRSTTLRIGEDINVVIGFLAQKRVSGANITVSLKNSLAHNIALFFSWDQGFYADFTPGMNYLVLDINELPLSPGEYFLDIGVNQSTSTVAFDVVLNVPFLRIINDGQVVQWQERPWGSLHWLKCAWRYDGER